MILQHFWNKCVSCDKYISSIISIVITESKNIQSFLSFVYKTNIYQLYLQETEFTFSYLMITVLSFVVPFERKKASAVFFTTYIQPRIYYQGFVMTFGSIFGAINNFVHIFTIFVCKNNNNVCCTCLTIHDLSSSIQTKQTMCNFACCWLISIASMKKWWVVWGNWFFSVTNT